VAMHILLRSLERNLELLRYFFSGVRSLPVVLACIKHPVGLIRCWFACTSFSYFLGAIWDQGFSTEALRPLTAPSSKPQLAALFLLRFFYVFFIGGSRPSWVLNIAEGGQRNIKSW